MSLGIIGGTGIDESILTKTAEHHILTPYGHPSADIIEGTIGETNAFFVLRHGKNHTLSPSRVNYRANIWALKELGVTHIIAPCAVGSLKENLKPGHLVFPDQLIDRTHGRQSTFYDKDKVMHISFAQPFCRVLRDLLIRSAQSLDMPYHPKGTNLVMEGPRFSTLAESQLYRSFGFDTINMTLMPEAVLAREVGIHYAPIAMVTDYDCWFERVVNWEDIQLTVKDNADKVKRIINDVAVRIKKSQGCSCDTDWKSAV